MSSYLSERHSRSMNTLSIQRPRPSIEMRTPAAASVPVKAALVNWLPWSVLKMSGLPKRASASSSAETQNEPSKVLDSRQDSTARLAQSMIATKEAAADRDVGDVRAPDLVRPRDGQPAQEIRVYLVPGRRLRCPRFRAERGNAHLAHQPPNTLAIDGMALRPQQRRHSPRAEERPSAEQLVDPPHRTSS